MPRRPRYLTPDGVVHMTARGNRGQLIFVGRGDERRFLAILDEVVRREGWRCFSYCLMPNHYHLLVEAEREQLSRGMHRLNGVYAQRFNLRYGLRGHLFQDRFYAAAIESDWHLLEATRYIDLNPPRAGLCPLPEDWRWSSHRALLGLAPRPRFLDVDGLLAHFGRDRRTARASYATFVEEGRRRALEHSLAA